jgi:ubiquinol-cytochrome c reductase cytochrome b subunit
MAGKIRDWLEVRIGLNELVKTNITEYRVPNNLNLFHTLGAVALVGYLIQIVSGIFLMMYYIPHADHAFMSVQHIMTQVPYGWLFRQMHVVGSNLLITAVILHMVTIFLMGSYKRPREITWVFGGLMLIMTFTFGLSGYLLPWTQLSYWATTVVTSIPTAFPVIGDFITRLLRGGNYVTGTTLTRFFALHVSVLPPLFLIFMAIHLALTKRIGISATPFGRSDEEKRPLTEFKKKTHPEGHSYYPYLFQRQALMVIGYFIVMFSIITFAPTFFFPEEAAVPADSFKTPENIRPEWYFLAPYQILKLIPNKFLGITFQLILLAVFILWPFLDLQKEKNIFKRPVLRGVFIFLLISWVILMWWGRR